MKAKKRVVTSGPRAGTSGRSKRRPSVRPIVPTIVSASREGRNLPASASAPDATAGPAGGRPSRRPDPGARGADAGPVDLRVDLAPVRGGLRLENPILTASGTFGYGVEHGEIVDIQRIGAICCKGTTLKARIGNIPPRVIETPAGMLNAIGLANPGVDAVIEKYGAAWARWRVPVIVNIAGASIGDYVEVARRLDGLPGVAGIELNLSCPNAAKGGLQFALDAGSAAAVTGAVRRATELPLLVKLSPNVADVRPIARAIAEAGADALSAINTLSGFAVAPTRDRPLLGNTYGGLSGPAIKPVALRIVYEVVQVVDVPVVAIGGVTTLADVLDYLAAGAAAVQVGTACFADPALPVRLVDQLVDECRRRGLTSYQPLVGTALPPRRSAPSAKGVEYRP